MNIKEAFIKTKELIRDPAAWPQRPNGWVEFQVLYTACGILSWRPTPPRSLFGKMLSMLRELLRFFGFVLLGVVLWFLILIGWMETKTSSVGSSRISSVVEEKSQMKYVPVQMPHNGHVPHGIRFRIPPWIHDKAMAEFVKHFGIENMARAEYVKPDGTIAVVYGSAYRDRENIERSGFGLEELIVLLAGKDPRELKKEEYPQATDSLNRWPGVRVTFTPAPPRSPKELPTAIAQTAEPMRTRNRGVASAANLPRRRSHVAAVSA